MARERKNLSFKDIVNLFTQYEEAKKEGNEEAVAALEVELSQIDPDLQDKAGNTVLMSAIHRKQAELAKVLIAKSRNVDLQDSFRRTALMWAIEQKQVELATLLIAKSYNLDLRDSFVGTALFFAIKYRQIEIAKLLIDKGANVDFQGSSFVTALFFAIKEGQIKIAKLLIDKGANVGVQGSSSVTALMLAIDKNQVEIVRLLILNGALHSGVSVVYQKRMTQMFTVLDDVEILEKLVASYCYRNDNNPPELITHLIVDGNVTDQESARRNILARSGISGAAADALMNNKVSRGFYCLSDDYRKWVYELSVNLSVNDEDIIKEELLKIGLKEQELKSEDIQNKITAEVKNRFAERLNNLCICTRYTDFMQMPLAGRKKLYQVAERALFYKKEYRFSEGDRKFLWYSGQSEIIRSHFLVNIEQFLNTGLLEKKIIGPRSISISQVLDQKLRENLPEVLAKVNGYINPAQVALNVYEKYSDYKMPDILLLRQKQEGIVPKPEGVEVVKDRQAVVESKAAAEDVEEVELSEKFEKLEKQDLDKGAEDKSSNKVTDILLEGERKSSLDRLMRQGEANFGFAKSVRH